MLSSTLPLAVVGATVVGFAVGFNVGATVVGTTVGFNVGATVGLTVVLSFYLVVSVLVVFTSALVVTICEGSLFVVT